MSYKLCYNNNQIIYFKRNIKVMRPQQRPLIVSALLSLYIFKLLLIYRAGETADKRQPMKCGNFCSNKNVMKSLKVRVPLEVV